MTCIVGVVDHGAVYLGGDSQLSAGWDKWFNKRSKVFRNGDLLVGCAGAPRLSQLLEFELQLPAQTTEKSFEYLVKVLAEQARLLFSSRDFKWDNEGGQVLFGYRGGLYTLENDYSVIQYNDEYVAIGCGANFAMGALHATHRLPPKKRIKKALKASAHLSNGVSGPFTILKL